MRIGIFFGGSSREREVSFAGGRTVYDNLNKALFDAVPIFVDSFGNFVLLDWHYIYKGSIRDFYPPVKYLEKKNHDFQIYAESLSSHGCDNEGSGGTAESHTPLTKTRQRELLSELGKPLAIEDLKLYIDFAFLTLNGENGEDGRLQGILEYEGIPYSGSGIYACSLGMDKVLQKTLMHEKGFKIPAYHTFDRRAWIEGDKRRIYDDTRARVGFPLVVKSARQGSSIGVTILMKEDFIAFCESVEKSLFRKSFTPANWHRGLKHEIIQELADFRQGPGLPVKVAGKVIYHPSDLYDYLDGTPPESTAEIVLESIFTENEILVEAFIPGKEFSCIVLDDTTSRALALPPTEIRKFSEIYDYRSKYLPGLSRKITPIDLPEDAVRSICRECERLFTSLGFNVYARIDGFITEDNTIILNDPNTTSGMLPSSFFFHQAAEIGLDPSQFLTYIIYCSLMARSKPGGYVQGYDRLLSELGIAIGQSRANEGRRIPVAVVFGGYSSERHISVESGRNIYEKLSSGITYKPLPVFLTGSAENIELYQVPINLLLKDNADDIREKIFGYHEHSVVKEIILRAAPIINLLGAHSNLASPKRLSFDKLAIACSVVFIALHGRPGEDGELQKSLEKVGLPYNGSGTESSQITIDKYRTNELLNACGILTSPHGEFPARLWKAGPDLFMDTLETRFAYPFIAKPVDDGCSSAVKKIGDRTDLRAYLELLFRETEELDPAAAAALDLPVTEEFPRKEAVLVEDLITARDATRFMEITGGLLTRLNHQGEIVYEVFDPSEALAGADVLSLEEKFLAGEGQNITPPRYADNQSDQESISLKVKEVFEKVARLLNIKGYCRIDAFVRTFAQRDPEIIIIEVNSLPGMTPATAIFHQAALAGYKPGDFIDLILEFAVQKKATKMTGHTRSQLADHGEQ